MNVVSCATPRVVTRSQADGRAGTRAHRSRLHRGRGDVHGPSVTSVVLLPGPLRREIRDALLALYRGWVETGRAELPQAFEGAARPNGQNVRSDEDTGERTNTIVPPMSPM